MKIIHFIFILLLLVSSVYSKETNYTASTPAAPVVRTFLGISLKDSIDFIRWKLTLQDNQYTLQCNYGIGKNNTNRFISGGKIISINGICRKEKNIFQLQHGNNTLKLVALNDNLLHILDGENRLLVGNGGWSYTLNNIAPEATDAVNLGPEQVILKDSMVFEGRSPCKVPGIIPAGMDCYKLKWYIVLYGDVTSNLPATYKVFGALRTREYPRTGNWKISKEKNGRFMYTLYDGTGHTFLDLLIVNENILLFTDITGNPLVGDEDFSYTLNRKW